MTPTNHPGWGGRRTPPGGLPRPPCGSRNGAVSHRRHKEPVCPACRTAANAHARAYYAASADSPRRLRAKARSRALYRLRRECPERFAAIFAQEIERHP
jgi:hypothetical protein